MLKRDFILAQIDEFTRIIVQMITNRKSGATRKNDEVIQIVYEGLKVDVPFLLSHSPEDIRTFLDRDDNGGLSRMEIAAKTLIEQSYLSPDPDQATSLLTKARQILEYIQQSDTTFSLERINLINELNNPENPF